MTPGMHDRTSHELKRNQIFKPGPYRAFFVRHDATPDWRCSESDAIGMARRFWEVRSLYDVLCRRE